MNNIQTQIFNKPRLQKEISKIKQKYELDINNINNTLFVHYNKNITFTIKISNSYPFTPCKYGIIIYNLVLLNSDLNKLPIDIIEKIQQYINNELYIKNIKKLFIDNDLPTKMDSIFDYDDIMTQVSPATYIIDIIERLVQLFIKYDLFTVLF